MALSLAGLAACGDDRALERGVRASSGEVTALGWIPSLTVPPGYGRRPGPETETAGDAAGEAAAPDEDAGPALADAAAAGGERHLLERSGALAVGLDIRGLLQRESALYVGDPDLVDALLHGDLPDGAGDGAGVVIEQVTSRGGEGLFGGVFDVF